MPRSFLPAAFLLGFAVAASAAEDGLRFRDPAPFTFDALVERARTLAREPYRPAPEPSPDVVGRIDYDAWGKIRYRPEHALFGQEDVPFPVTFFHLGMYFRKPVRMHLVAEGRSRELIYDLDLFEAPEDSPARELPEGVGFAGFRIQEAKDGELEWQRNDWAAFLGASYFRAIGELRQYGLSARGLALDVAQADQAEEFPDFTDFYLEQTPGTGVVTVHALLQGPSVSGAFRFLLRRDAAVIMDVEQALFLRRPVSRLGLAPLTSMYWFSETRKPTAVDWRPEVHDSDGLAILTGGGERLWRPLNNPARTMVSSFLDENPKGFGLSQRDRNFELYLDGVAYDRRPTLWVEPRGDWGRGSVQLVEIPTDDEIHDNIVAMWVPEGAAQAGAEFRLRYRLHWVADEPGPHPLARCVATRLGNGGQPGRPRPAGVRKFVLEFLGGPLADLPFGVLPEAVLTTSRGTISNVFTEAVPNGRPGHWRASFDLAAPGPDPVELRAFLRRDAQPLTETWLYQYHPF
jgi:glucans biosynthesis protein